METWRVVIISQFGDAAANIDRVLRESGHEPVAVMTARPVDDGPERQQFFLRVYSESPRDLDILVPANSKRIAPLIAPYEPDLVVCCGFPWLIPPEALAVPLLGAINMHPSLLPGGAGHFRSHGRSGAGRTSARPCTGWILRGTRDPADGPEIECGDGAIRITATEPASPGFTDLA